MPSYIWLTGGNTFNINTGYGIGNKSIPIVFSLSDGITKSLVYY